MSLINRIKSNFAKAVRKRCSERGCDLKLKGLSNYVILKGEIVRQNCKMCDYIIFELGDSLILGVIELKSKTAHHSEIVEKLGNGSRVALDILRKCSNPRVNFNFYHLVLCKRWHTSEYSVITNRKIAVYGRKYPIIPKRCGVSFLEVISTLG